MTAALPRPGPRWGDYPVRHQSPNASRGRSLWGWRALPARWPKGAVLAWHRGWLRLVDDHRAQAQQAGAPTAAAVAHLADAVRLQLRREGFTPASLARALACVDMAMALTSGRRLHPLQLVASAHLLDQSLVEMATGEGKSMVMAAAALVGGLAAVPVHLLTANDYLAERDAAALAPLCQALGLSVAHLPPGQAPDHKLKVYAHDIVCTTAKEAAFDHLRDMLGPAANGHDVPVMRGLCLALIDEADSILLDEAVVPLVISCGTPEAPEHRAARRALWWQAWQLSAGLQSGEHFVAQTATRRVVLTAQGQMEVDRLAQGLAGLWRRQATRQELVSMALTARHLLIRDHHYLVRDQRIDLLDTLTGRVAAGRVWSQGLQALIELKEGCPASGPTTTLSQITYQRFFQRYWRLGGVSGTLAEARGELQQVYGCPVRCLPLRQPSRRIDLPARVFESPQARWEAVAQRALALSAQGRPVLIGTDSVADSEALSACLQRHGVRHTVLNARNDRDEARVVAEAGRAGQITVATRMAGRGTDILLDELALKAGGLHVVACQHNESRRMDRQLLGRAARQGQPGSTETWICSTISSECGPAAAPMLSRSHSSARHLLAGWRLPLWGHRWLRRTAQWIEEHRQADLRRRLQEQDRQWEEQQRQLR